MSEKIANLNPEFVSDRQKVACLGNLALSKCDEYKLINDSFVHLCQYLERGEEAITGISQDIITDIAERLPETPFVNYVDFQFTGDDFVSVKDRVSMELMTKGNLDVLARELTKNPSLKAEYDRAKVEAMEVEKLCDWFITAPLGSHLVFESLPIGSQEIAVSRIYRKSDDDKISGCFVSLYNPSIDVFNDFRRRMGINSVTNKTEKDILQNHYEFYNPALKSARDFVDYYVSNYDQALWQKSGEQSHFGLDPGSIKTQNGIEKVSRQNKLRSLYTDMIRTLANGEGKVTSEVIEINETLGVGHNLYEGQLISVERARKILKDVINGVTGIIHKADKKTLDAFEKAGSIRECRDTVASLGGQVQAEGRIYHSNACPEWNDTNDENDSESEKDILLRRFNIWGLENFGEQKIGVCRIPNCPTHGKSKRYKNATIVGGCDVCVNCHLHFQNGKLPQEIYAEQEMKAERRRVEYQNKMQQFGQLDNLTKNGKKPNLTRVK